MADPPGPAERIDQAELAALRARIDALDVEIVRLLNQRAQLGLDVGRAKARSGQPVADSEREREVLVRVAMANDGPLPQDALLALYRQLIETIKRLEEIQAPASSPADQAGGRAGDTA
jgi:chorismate mutase